MSVKVEGLTKIYGVQKAVDSVSFEAKKGEVLGFLGPNGAGKSTTMKMATGYILPSSGTIEICGIDAVKDSQKVRGLIGYLPEYNPLYLDMYVKEYLNLFGKIHKMSGIALQAKIKEVIDLCGLAKEQKRKIGQLSKGFRQRVGLAQTLLHDPEVLVLDEPTTGLDPNQLVEIRTLIKSIAKEKTVILSTHIMQEVQAICDRVVVINSGKLVADEEIDQIVSASKSLKVEFQSRINPQELESFGTVRAISERIYSIQTSTNDDIRPQLFEMAKTKDWVILSMNMEYQDLESFFQEKTREE